MFLALTCTETDGRKRFRGAHVGDGFPVYHNDIYNGRLLEQSKRMQKLIFNYQM